MKNACGTSEEASGQQKKLRSIVEVQAVFVEPAVCNLVVIATAATALIVASQHGSPSTDSSATASSSSPAPSSLLATSSLATPLAPTPIQFITATQRRTWLQSEDVTIRRLVSVHGTRSWELVAQECPGRTGKQCRERWHNRLDQHIKKSAWCRRSPCRPPAAPAARCASESPSAELRGLPCPG